MKILISESQYNYLLLESSPHFTWVLNANSDDFKGTAVTFTNPIKDGKNYSIIKNSQMYSPKTKKQVFAKLFWSTTSKPPYNGVSDLKLVEKLNAYFNKKYVEDSKTLKERRLEGSLFKDASNSPVKYIYSEDYTRNKQFLKDQGMLGWDAKADSASQHFNIAAFMSMQKINRMIFENRFNNGKGEGTINNCFGVGLRENKSANGLRYDNQLLNSYDFSSFETLWKNFRGKNGGQQNISGQPDDFSDMFWGFYSADMIWGGVDFMKDIKNNFTTKTYYSKDGWYNLYGRLYVDSAGTTDVYKIMSIIRSKPLVRGCGVSYVGDGGFVFSIHDVLALAQVFSYLIPIAGPIIAAGIGTIDAGIYYYEGKGTEAAITLGLSILPFVSRIPVIKNIGVETMNKISKKIATGAKLDKVEAKAMKLVEKYKDSVNSDLKGFVKSAKDYVDGKGLSDFKKEALQKKVKNNVKEALAGDYGVFLSRWKGGPLQKALKATEQGLKYYKNYLKKTNLASKVDNLKKGDLRKGKNNYFVRFGNEYWTSKIGPAKSWYSVNNDTNLMQGVLKNWDKYTVVA